MSVAYAMPLVLTGLPPATAITVTVVRYGANTLAAGPLCCPRPADVLTFTTAAAPLATGALAAAPPLTLTPNPAQGRAHLALADPLSVPAVALVLDALGREVRRLPLPARAPTVTLDLTGLTPGFYLVRAGGCTARLVLE